MHFFTLNNEISESESEKTISLKITLKNTEEWTLSRRWKPPYAENHKTLIKEIGNDSKKWKGIPCYWIGRIHIVKMTTLSKATYGYNALCSKRPMTSFTEQEQIILNFIRSYERPKTAKAVLREVNKIGGITLPDFRQCYKATVIKTLWYWPKNIHMDQRIRRESSEIHLHTYG